MKQMYVIGNWKMNGNRKMVRHFLDELRQQASTTPHIVWIVLLPYIFLQLAQEILEKTHVLWGAQNVHHHQNGSYTGEISASMLLDFGCSFVLIGHSERRFHAHEDNALLVAKMNGALQYGLNVLVCIGEEEKTNNIQNNFARVRDQLNPILEQASIHRVPQLILGYEPVWAIGAHTHPEPSYVQDMCALIKNECVQWGRSEIPILYGGSVNSECAHSYAHLPPLDGFLVGRAALDVQQFLKIGSACNY